MQKKQKRSSPNAANLRMPILLIRWGGTRGKQGMREAGHVRDDFRHDPGLQFDDLRDKKEEVKKKISLWLTDPDHPDGQVAQNLYIGSHGNKNGLSATSRPKPWELMTWGELASVLSPARRPIVLWLGACNSSYAAEAWSKPGMNVPVQLIVGFSGEPDDKALVPYCFNSHMRPSLKTTRLRITHYLVAGAGPGVNSF